MFSSLRDFDAIARFLIMIGSMFFQSFCINTASKVNYCILHISYTRISYFKKPPPPETALKEDFFLELMTSIRFSCLGPIP